MNMKEYLQVKDYTYLEYCDYLQKKYGVGLSYYMTKSWNKNPKVTRTKDGLLAHHKMEDKMIMLSTKEFAMMCPYEWQEKGNIVYCDYLEHLLLHILICKYPSPDKMPGVDVGVGGVIDFLVPELNDLYSGWKTGQTWRKTCHNKVVNDKDVYMALLKQFIENEKKDFGFSIEALFSSFNERYGIWDSKKNIPLYKEISELM